MEGRNTVDEHNRMAGRNTPEELSSEALSELVIDMLHRIAVHHIIKRL